MDSLRQAGQAMSKGDYPAAIPALKRLLTKNRDHWQARQNLAIAFLETGAFQLALHHAEILVRQIGATSATDLMLGVAYAALGDDGAAKGHLRNVVATEPNNLRAWIELGLVLQRQDCLAEARHCFTKAHEITPNLAAPLVNLGNVAKAEGDLDAAHQAHRAAFSIAPGHADICLSFASTLQARGQYDEAEALLERALACDPHHARARKNLGVIRLWRRDFVRGWSDFNERHRLAGRPVRREIADLPQWDGKPVPPQTPILIWGEQGIGDEILMHSLLPEVQALGFHIVLECDDRLIPLIRRSFPAIRPVSRKNAQALKALSRRPVLQIPTMALAELLRPTFDVFPEKPEPFLRPDADMSGTLRRAYCEGGKIVVGLSWYSGNKSLKAFKSCALDLWRGVLKLPNVRFINLQYGPARAEAQQVADALGIDIITEDSIDPMVDMDGFAAQVASCDFVVSVSNTTVHVAGALGIPTFVLLPPQGGMMWYWFDEPDFSPWYSSLSLIRFDPAQGWNGSLQRATEKLLAEIISR